MRSTTVGWFTSMVRVLPVSADHMWLNRACPEARESINHQIEPTASTPRNRPRTRATTTAAEDRAGLAGREPAPTSEGMLQGYHHATPEGAGLLQGRKTDLSDEVTKF